VPPGLHIHDVCLQLPSEEIIISFENSGNAGLGNFNDVPSFQFINKEG
jgi:hypothetical protein